MNHQELEAIRARVAKDTTVSHHLTQVDHDRAALLAELDRKWRLLEDADAKINEVRRITDALVDAEPPIAGDLVRRLRKIVGPR